MSRTTAQNLAWWIAAGAATAFAAVAGTVAITLPYQLERELWLLRATGYGALGALFVALSVTPATRLASRVAPGRVRSAVWTALRRSFGITSAWLGLGHGALALSTYLWGSWEAVLQWPYLRAGLVALGILVVLLVTSFPRLIALLRVRLWKPLHRLAYAAAFFLLQHLLLSPFAPRALTLWFFGGLVAFGLLRFLPSRAGQQRQAL